MRPENKLLTGELEKDLKTLGLKYLLENWDQLLLEAKRCAPSYHRFLSDIISQEAHHRSDRQRQARVRRANIQEILLMTTFPFEKQPNLKKKLALEIYESLEYMRNPQDLIFIGPTGCGKSGLSVSYLIHAINQGFRGYFIDFKDLLDRIWSAIGDHTEKALIRKLVGYDCLVIDELGHTRLKEEQASAFFEIMKKRHRKKTTLITTQMGYDEWGEFLLNKHMTAAMIDRLTENCTVFNMKKCISIRPKNVRIGTTET